MPTHLKNNVPWSALDIRLLRRFARRGDSAREAASLLGRSYGATRFKAMTAGVRFMSLGRAHSRAQKRRWR